MYRAGLLLVVLSLAAEIILLEYDSESKNEDQAKVTAELSKKLDLAKKYIQHIESMMDTYSGQVGNQLMVETNALVNTKYRTWKRNADLINSLLALPKAMNDAGR